MRLAAAGRGNRLSIKGLVGVLRTVECHRSILGRHVPAR
jgi:hypothetical protein